MENVWVRTERPIETETVTEAGQPRLDNEVPSLRLIQALGETGYWRLNLKRVSQCHEVIVFNWNGTRRLVAPIVASRCYTVKHFDQIRVVVGFDKTQARFEEVSDPPHWGRAVNGYTRANASKF